MASIKQLDRDLDKILHEKMMLVYSCIGIVMRKRYHWEKNGILNLFEKCEEVWKECAKDNSKSMVQMLDEEVGIEIQIGDGKSWKEIAFLNAEYDFPRLTRPQWIYMRMRQRKWILPQITACMLLALHRKCGFDSDQIEDVYERLLKVEQDNLFDPVLACHICEKVTGVRVMEVTG